MLKKPYYEKTCFFWSLYCKTLLATCWIGGFLFGYLAWCRCGFTSADGFFSAEFADYTGFLTMLASDLLLLGIGYLVSAFLSRMLSSLYVFIRTALFFLSMIGLSLVYDLSTWCAVFIWQGVSLSLEFLIYFYFTNPDSLHYSL